jgi:hypothetical protein
MKNIEILKNLLDGTSKYHTKTTVGFSDIESKKEKFKKRETGEVWPEVGATGDILCWWEQKDGYRVKYNVHPDIAKKMQEVRDSLRSFPNCPKETCTCTMPKPIDIKFRMKTGMCEECTISYETKLKIEGKFKEYAIDKMKNNALAFFSDADKEVEEIKKQISDVSFVGENGEIEKWSMDNYEDFRNKIDEQYAKFKQEILESFEAKK